MKKKTHTPLSLFLSPPIPARARSTRAPRARVAGGTRAPMPPAWLRRRTVDPLLALARAGTAPRTLARSFALGFAVGTCPLLGAPLPLLACVLTLSRWLSPPGAAAAPLNAPALLLGNAASFPVEAALLLPYVRAGAWATGTALPPLSPAALRRELWHNPRSLVDVLAGACGVWLVSVPFVAAAVARLVEPAIGALAARTAAPPPQAADVERAPLAAARGSRVE